MRNFLLILILFISISTVSAQDARYYVGVEAGPSLVSLRNENNNDLKSKIGYAAGASFEYFVIEKFGIKSGIMYERKGAKDELFYIDAEGNPDGTQDIDNVYDYLIVPVFMSFHTKGFTDFYANAGPYFGFLLSNMVYYEESGKFPGKKEDFTSETNSVDIGFSIGVGTNIDLNENLVLSVELRENLGLSKTIGTTRTNALGLMAGLKYKLE